MATSKILNFASGSASLSTAFLTIVSQNIEAVSARGIGEPILSVASLNKLKLWKP